MDTGYIYRVVPLVEHDISDVYYGSTKRKINERRNCHKADYKRYKRGLLSNKKICSVVYLFEKYGLRNCMIEVLEIFYFVDLNDLREREKYYIRNNLCVNKVNNPLSNIFHNYCSSFSSLSSSSSSSSV